MKCQEQEYEIKDIKSEYQDEKESLLDTIRYQNQDIDFYKKIVEAMIPSSELSKIRNRTKWNDNTDNWDIPLFIVRNKAAVFPNFSKLQGIVEF